MSNAVTRMKMVHRQLTSNLDSVANRYLNLGSGYNRQSILSLKAAVAPQAAPAAASVGSTAAIPDLAAQRTAATRDVYLATFGIFLAFLVVRNLILSYNMWQSRRERLKRQTQGVAWDPEEARSSKVLRSFDSVGNTMVSYKSFGAEWTVFRFVVTLLVVAINLGAVVIEAELHSAEAQRNAGRRLAHLGLCNLPIVFVMSGRRNLLGYLTGFSYQDIKPYHKLFGLITCFELIAHSSINIHRMLTRLNKIIQSDWVHMGILASVSCCVILIAALPATRKHAYEFFYFFHLLAAILVLVGAWYHKSQTHSTITACVILFVFDRIVRLLSNVLCFPTSQSLLPVPRPPLLTAHAKYVSGAVVLRVPYQGAWEGGQHFFISFWDTGVLKPLSWASASGHPFTVVNHKLRNGTGHFDDGMVSVSIDDKIRASDPSELLFVIRKHKGLTRELAEHVIANTFSSSSAEIKVSLEGPYNGLPKRLTTDDEFEGNMFVAGGSGITYCASTMMGLIERAQFENKRITVGLLWVVRTTDQIGWVRSTMLQIQAIATQAEVPLVIQIHVTRPDTLLKPKKYEGGFSEDLIDCQSIDDIPGIDVRSGHPQFESVISGFSSLISGKTLVLACGPPKMQAEVGFSVERLSSPRIQYEGASYQM